MEKLVIVNADNSTTFIDLTPTTKLSDIIVKHPEALAFYLARSI